MLSSQQVETRTFFFRQRGPCQETRSERRRIRHQEPSERTNNSKSSALLAAKERNTRRHRPSLSHVIAEELDDGLGVKSLLPAISISVNLIRQRLDALLTHDEDSQRQIFNQARSKSDAMLSALAKVLYKSSDNNNNSKFSSYSYPSKDTRLKMLSAQSLHDIEVSVTRSHRDLVQDARRVAREWQLLSNRDAYLSQILARSVSSGEATSTQKTVDLHNSLVLNNAVLNSQNASLAGSVIADDDRSPTDKRPPKIKVMTQANNAVTSGQLNTTPPGVQKLADIREDDEVSANGRRSTNLQRPSTELAKGSRLSVQNKVIQRVKAIKQDGSTNDLSKSASITDNSTSKRFLSTSSNQREEDLNLSKVSGQGGYWAVISFQLSSKLSQDKGWLLSPDTRTDMEKETLLKWAIHQLRMAIKSSKHQSQLDIDSGNNKSIIVSYYGEARASTPCHRYLSSCSPTYENLLNKPPVSLPTCDNRQLFQTTINDGSSVVYYASGYIAIVVSRSPPIQTQLCHNAPASIGSHTSNSTSSTTTLTATTLTTTTAATSAVYTHPNHTQLSHTYYTYVFSDCPQQVMLAVFSPSGKACCYHADVNTNAPRSLRPIRLLADDRGGVISGETGEISRKWSWPPNKGKLSHSIVIQFNANVSFRCTNHYNMHVAFSSTNQNARFNVGKEPGCKAPQTIEELGRIITNLPFMSRTAKEYAKPLIKNDLMRQRKNKSKKTRSAISLEIKRILEFDSGGSCIGDEDKIFLTKLQIKIKEICEAWMDHYRVMLGIGSPLIRKMNVQKSLFVRSRPKRPLSSTTTGLRVVIESKATSIPKVQPIVRHPSAPNVRCLLEDHCELFPQKPATSMNVSQNTTPPTTTSALQFTPQQQQAFVTFSREDNEDIQIIVPQLSFSNSTPTTCKTERSRRSHSIFPMPQNSSHNDASNRPRHDIKRPVSKIRSQSAPPRKTNRRKNSLHAIAEMTCPLAMRAGIMGERLNLSDPVNLCLCRPSTQDKGLNLPRITDVEFDCFVSNRNVTKQSNKQLTVIAVINSLNNDDSYASDILEKLLTSLSRCRGNSQCDMLISGVNSCSPAPPAMTTCAVTRRQPFRLLAYDVCTAAQFTSHTQPLLMRRHNVSQGMYLVYGCGKLLFCDHIFDGYSVETKHFHRQLITCRQLSNRGRYLPSDFRFSPIRFPSRELETRESHSETTLRGNKQYTCTEIRYAEKNLLMNNSSKKEQNHILSIAKSSAIPWSPLPMKSTQQFIEKEDLPNVFISPPSTRLITN